MASLAQRVSDGFSRVASEIKNSIRPRLLPPGGGGGMMLIRASDAVNSFGWAIPPQGAPSPHFCSVYMDSGTPVGGTIATDPTAPPFNRFAFDHAVKDDDKCWDQTNQWYTVRESGLYMITAMMRLPDSLNNTYFGFGIDSVQTDNENFLWTARFGGPTQWGFQYSRLRYLTANQQIRAFGYNILFKPTRATMEIGMVSKPF